VPIGDIQPGNVRRWRTNLLAPGVSEITVAKAYRLLKAVLNTAVDDGVIKRRPCRIKGAGQEDSPERPTLTVAQVYALAEAVGQRYPSPDGKLLHHSNFRLRVWLDAREAAGPGEGVHFTICGIPETRSRLPRARPSAS
jgi:hypothetical protein